MQDQGDSPLVDVEDKVMVSFIGIVIFYMVMPLDHLMSFQSDADWHSRPLPSQWNYVS